MLVLDVDDPLVDGDPQDRVIAGARGDVADAVERRQKGRIRDDEPGIPVEDGEAVLDRGQGIPKPLLGLVRAPRGKLQLAVT
jgi:hypothetical protein